MAGNDTPMIVWPVDRTYRGLQVMSGRRFRTLGSVERFIPNVPRNRTRQAVLVFNGTVYSATKRGVHQARADVEGGI